MTNLTPDLRHAADRANLTHKEIAERLGCSRSNVTRMFKDGTNLTIGTLERLGEVLGVEIRVEIAIPSDLTGLQARFKTKR